MIIRKVIQKNSDIIYKNSDIIYKKLDDYKQKYPEAETAPGYFLLKNSLIMKMKGFKAVMINHSAYLAIL